MNWHGVPRKESKLCPECNGAGGWEHREWGCDPEWYECQEPGCNRGHVPMDLIHWHLIRRFRVAA